MIRGASGRVDALEVAGAERAQAGVDVDELLRLTAVVLSSYGGGGTSILRVNPEDRSLASGSSASHG
eukprot:COSAG06_NODE_15979_length_1031_cov_1.340129_1_plen_66_part_10